MLERDCHPMWPEQMRQEGLHIPHHHGGTAATVMAQRGACRSHRFFKETVVLT